MARNLRRHAVVIGASMAGLATARVLAERFDAVTILDRDELPEDASPRKAVPQGRHAHALLAGGARAIVGLFPGIADEFVEGGAAVIDFNDGYWFQAGGYRCRNLLDRNEISASRPFIEGTIRGRVAALPNVTIQTGVAVEGLLHDAARVAGVRVFDGTSSRAIHADLVVDCSGRASQASLWLEELGYPAPEVVEVRCDVRYATVILRRSPSDLDGCFAVTLESPPHGKRAAFLIPIEGDRWIATIASSFGAPAPLDLEGFRTAAASLPAPEMAQVMARAEPLTAVATHRLVSSKRRSYEKATSVPAGFVALGDSICSFNPIYGQGMSVAVLEAVALGECIDTHDQGEAMVRAFYKQAAKIVATPWAIAVGADFAYPECTGPKRPGTDLVNR
jgi:2-polyprenyl-6-methoxyphenol hydroxylase-like FAD-dependent oxidoreductase